MSVETKEFDMDAIASMVLGVSFTNDSAMQMLQPRASHFLQLQFGFAAWLAESISAENILSVSEETRQRDLVRLIKKYGNEFAVPLMK